MHGFKLCFSVDETSRDTAFFRRKIRLGMRARVLSTLDLIRAARILVASSFVNPRMSV
tara:strand:- start:522 stop:695 length:174 start_codon:yes stop_codon:yes gene_type:complete